MMKTITELTATEKEKRLVRLAAYVRVSSDSEDQLHSFAAQVKYYTDYTSAHPENVLVDIYADEAVTGTRTDKRDDFNRLLRDCRKGKIDRIIVKSVSRFARNTAELLTAVRMLKTIGVSIYFEEQGIDSATIDLEMILTFPGMAAQKESEIISDNMRWSYQKRMESGEFNFCRAAYGYELVDGELRINETEAAVVRRIFSLYLSGYGKQAIANLLNAEGAAKRYGNTTWHTFTVSYILNNERYMGDALLQKSYTTDALPFRKVRNHGEKAQYYVENSNPPIVSRETYQAAQELQKSKATGGFTKKDRYPMSAMLKCPVCGHNYRRQIVNGIAYWVCSYKASGRSECASERIREDTATDAFIRLTNNLTENREELLGDLIRQLEKMQNRVSSSQEKVYQLDRQIADVNAQSLVVAQLHNNGVLNSAEFTAQSGELSRKVSALRSERRRILMEDEDDELIDTLRELNDTLAGYTSMEAFDEDLFEQIVDSIVVVNGQTLRFLLTGGLALTERI